MHNRLYLNPHLPDKLSGTILNYDFRGDKLIINLDKGRYSISNNQFKLTSQNNFGCNAGKNELEYFNSNNDTYSLKARPEKTGNLSVEIVKWNENEKVWIQTAISGKSKIIYSVCNFVPDNQYVVLVDGQIVKTLKSNKEGRLTFDATADKNSSEIHIQRENNRQWKSKDKEANEMGIN
jgi:hypothetical protein